MKVRDLLRLLRERGFRLTRQTGSHRPYESGLLRVTVSGHENDDVHPKTLRSIMKQAGLSQEDD